MMKTDAELCEQWDPGILVKKTIRLAVRDVDRTKRLFLGSRFQILEAICSERPARWPSWLSGFSPGKCGYQHDLHWDIMQQLCGIARQWDPIGRAHV